VDTGRHRDDGPLARQIGRLAVKTAPTHVSAENGKPPAMTRVPWPLPMATLAALAAAALLVGHPDGSDASIGSVASGWVLLTGLAVVVLAASPSAAPHAGALDWLVPAALRAAEYLFVLAVGVIYAVPLPLLFVLLFMLALRHYDLTARMEKKFAEAPGRAGVAGAAGLASSLLAPGRAWDIGWDGRVAVLAAGAALGVATVTVAVLAGYVAVVFGLGVLGAWAVTRIAAEAGGRAGR